MVNSTSKIKSVSCSEMVFSCLPVVGSALCLWNMMKIDHERSRSVASLSRLEKRAERGRDERGQVEKAREKYINILEKGISYSKCGVVSSFLTIAVLVALLATAVLAVGGAIPLIMGFVIHAGIYRQNLTRFSEDLEEITEEGSIGEQDQQCKSIRTTPQNAIEPVRAVLSQLIPELSRDVLSSSTAALGQTTRW